MRLVKLSVLAFAALLLGAAPASADVYGPQTREANYAKATCTITTYQVYVHDDAAQLDCQIWDKMVDGDGTYVSFQIDGYEPLSMYGDGGAPVSEMQYNPDGSIGTVRWKVCDDNQFPVSDDCTSTVEYNPSGTGNDTQLSPCDWLIVCPPPPIG